jgi:type I restriction enzyme S subunit
VTKLAGFEFTNYIHYSDAGEIIALRALNIKDEKLNLSDIQRIQKSISDSLPRSKIFADEILITYIGAYIGDVLLITESNRFHPAPKYCQNYF